MARTQGGHARRTVGRRLAGYEKALVAALTAVVAACVGTTLLLDGMRASGARAEVDSAFGVNAGFEYTVQVSDPATRQVLDAAGLPRVGTTTGNARTKDGMLDVSVMVSTDPRLVTGIGTDVGDAPRAGAAQPGDVAVSTAAAQSLALRAGDSIDLKADGLEGSFLVRRVFVVPNDPSLRAVAVVGGPSDAATGAQRWLLNDADFAVPAIAAALNDPSADVALRGSRQAAVERTDVLETGRFSALRYISVLGIIVTLCAWTAVVAMSRPRLRSHLSSLAALGLEERDARIILGRTLTVGAISGVAIGALVGWGALVLLYQVLGRVIDQAWQTAAISVDRTATVLAMTCLGTMVLARLLLHDPRRGTNIARVPLPGRAQTLVGLLGMVVAGTAFVASRAMIVNPYEGALVCGLALLPAALTAARVIGDHWVEKKHLRVARAARIAAGGTWAPALLVAVVALAGTTLAAQASSERSVGEQRYTPMQPPSSIIVNSVDAETRVLVDEAWASATGRATPPVGIIGLPDQSATRFFAATPEFVACAATQRHRLGEQDCPVPPDVYVSPADVGVGSENLPGARESAGAVIADPSLVVGGKVGLLATDTRRNIIGTWIVEAVPHAALGDLVPGAVLDPASPIAAELGITESNSTFLILDGTHLSTAELDAAAARVAVAASAAQISVEAGYDDQGLGAFTVFASVGAAALAGGIALLFGLGIVRSSSSFRTVLHGLGPRRRIRWTMGMVIMSEPFVALAAVPIALAATASLWGTRTVSWATLTVALPAITVAIVYSYVVVTLTRGAAEEAAPGVL